MAEGGRRRRRREVGTPSGGRDASLETDSGALQESCDIVTRKKSSLPPPVLLLLPRWSLSKRRDSPAPTPSRSSSVTKEKDDFALF